MDVLQAITTRRTTQIFDPKYVSWEKIAKILDAARHAPSSGNIQNWRFIVLVDPAKKQTLASHTFDQYEISQAAALIVVCADPQTATRYYGARGERLYSIQNCAAAMQNMLLAAHGLGLGSRWVGAFDEDAIKEQLGIPEHIRPQGIIAVGHAEGAGETSQKYPLETITFFGSWRNKLRDPAKYMNDIATILARKAGNIKEAIEEGVKHGIDKLKE